MADDDVPLAALARSAPTKEKKRDEGASLASLAKAKVKIPKSAADNTPLTALAKAGAPQKRASGAVKPKPKAGDKKTLEKFEQLQQLVLLLHLQRGGK